ncbi:MAG: P-II family nitrogen regulator [Candidatus Methanoperedens sp.]
MKKIEAIIRRESVNYVMDELEKIGIFGLTVWDVSGRGKQKGITQKWGGKEYNIRLLPKSKLEIVVPDKELEKVKKVISSSARTGNIGDGKIFISDISEAERIRTGEQGEKAL